MGSQIRYYMTVEDEIEFIRFLRSTGEIIISPEVNRSSIIRTLDSFSKNAEVPDRDVGCVFWNRDISPEPKVVFVPNHGGQYVIDKFESEVIEVIPCLRSSDKISLGRLFIEKRIMDQNGKATYKSKKFISWYERISRWIRKNYEKDDAGDYLSIRVAALKKKGLVLVGHCV